MPFRYIMANLLAKVPNALGAIFLDDSGETIELASAEYSPEELRVFGAYFGISLRQTKQIINPTDLGTLRLLQMRHKDVDVYSVCLPDGYFLVLLQKRPAVSGVAREALRTAVSELERELFS